MAIADNGVVEDSVAENDATDNRAVDNNTRNVRATKNYIPEIGAAENECC